VKENETLIDVVKLDKAIMTSLAEMGRANASFVVVIADGDTCAVGTNVGERDVAAAILKAALRIVTTVAGSAFSIDDLGEIKGHA
jgi:hypothetical protein